MEKGCDQHFINLVFPGLVTKLILWRWYETHRCDRVELLFFEALLWNLDEYVAHCTCTIEAQTLTHTILMMMDHQQPIRG